MDYYIRNIRYKKSFFTKKIYLHFEYYLCDKWRKGRTLYLPDFNNPSYVYVVSSINSFVSNKINNGRLPFSLEELKDMVTMSVYYNDFEGCTKIHLS